MAGDEAHTETVTQVALNDESSVSFRQIVALTFANKRILVAGVLVAVFSFASKPIFMYWPQIVAELKMPEALRGWTVLAMSIPIMIGSLIAGHTKLIPHNKRGLSLLLLVLSMGLLLAGLAQNLAVFIAGLAIIEFAYGAMAIVTYGYLYVEVHSSHRTTVNSMMSATRTLGGAISLLAMGEIADLLSPQAAIAITGGVVLLVLLYKYVSKD